MKFTKEYFNTMYSEDKFIDGDFNARQHALYLKGLFDLMEIEGRSIIDFGFGKGELLYQVSKAFHASKVDGLDISNYALSFLQKKNWAKNWSLHLSSIHEFRSKFIFDLGLSNSVLQYVESHLLEETIRVMAERVRFLYFHVPTTEDYTVLKQVLKFKDPYAIERPKALYQEHITKYFTVVAWGVLESKINGRKGTPFTDAFYRN